MAMLRNLASALKKEEGQGFVEYALLICLVVIVVGFVLIFWGQYLAALFYHFIDIIASWCLY